MSMSFTERIRIHIWIRRRIRSRDLRNAGAVAAFALAACVPGHAAKPRVPQTVVRLPLAELGFPGYTLALMHAGASMATVHMIDSSHLLFTYSLRSLVPRLPGDDENDQDRLVAAEIVSIPSGKILDRTEWHLHDHGRYLWSAGHGVFILRSGDELSTFAPVRGLADGTPFQRVALPHRPGHPVVINASPDGKVITIQVQPPKEDHAGDEPVGDSGGEHAKSRHTVIEFYRVEVPEQPGRAIELRAAGVIGSPGLLALALDGDGYLWADDASRSAWKVSFNEYGGGSQTLTDVHSSCSPRMHLLSRSEFAVVTCGVSGDAGSRMLAAYGFDGHENWQEAFGELLQPPEFVAAAEVGRFAMSRLSANGGGSGIAGLGQDDSTLSQEIRVYQTESGDLLLDLQCAPAVRSPENFDLSPDGRALAVLGSKTLDVYALPELTAQDRKDLAEVEAMRPPAATGLVRLTRITRPVGAGSDAGSGEESSSTRRLLTANGDLEPATAGIAAAPKASVAASEAKAVETKTGEAKTAGAAAPADPSRAAPGVARQSEASGDGGADAASRKPPTLLQPGESPEFKPARAPQ